MKLTKKVSAASLAVGITYASLALAAPAASVVEGAGVSAASTRFAHHCNGKCGTEVESTRLAPNCSGKCNGKCGTDVA